MQALPADQQGEPSRAFAALMPKRMREAAAIPY